MSVKLGWLYVSGRGRGLLRNPCRYNQDVWEMLASSPTSAYWFHPEPESSRRSSVPLWLVLKCVHGCSILSHSLVQRTTWTPWTACSLPTRLLWAWNFPGKHIGVGCNFLLQKIFLTQGLNLWLLLCLLHYRLILYCWAAGKAQSVSIRFQTGNLQHGEANVITTTLWKGGR